MTERLSAIVLAAGEGSRMRSTLPKPLHRLCGRPMVLHVIEAVTALEVGRVVVVVGHEADRVTSEVAEMGPVSLELEFALQREQRGTGDALSTALRSFGVADDDDDVIVVPGDTPLLTSASLAALVEVHRDSDAAATVLTARLDDPSGYGRVVRSSDGRVAAIVEDVDASPAERAIDEVNTSIYCFRRSLLAPALRRLAPTNAQGELYLTDVINVLFDAGYVTAALPVDDPIEAVGVNDRVQLAAAEAGMRRRINEGWMRRGVTMWDPATTFVDVGVELSNDVTLLAGTVLRGKCRIGSGASIGPSAVLSDTVVGEWAVLGTVVAEEAEIGQDAIVASFCVLPAGTKVAAGSRIEPGWSASS